MGKRQWRLLIAVAFLTTNVTWNCGCRKIPDPPPTSEICDIAGLPFAQPDTTASPVVDIYLDRSGSMMGFVSDPQSGYARALKTLIERLTIADYKVSYHAFSGQVQALPNLDPKTLLKTDFYSGLETPLASWLVSIARREHEGKISVLISDLVQSEGTNDQSALIRALVKVTETRPEMRLLAFRSRFHGMHYVETRPGEYYDLSLPAPGQSEDSGGRPFYLLVFGPSRAAMERLDTYVLRDLGFLHDLKPTDPAVFVDSLGYTAPRRPNAEWRRWKEHLNRRLPIDRCIHGWQMAFLHYAGGSRGTEPLMLGLRAEERVPLRSAKSVESRVERWTQTRDGWSESETIEGVGIDLINAAENGDWTRGLSIEFGRPKAECLELYHIQLKPGGANLGPPPWVLDWSTDDDSRAANGNRTLNLRLLVEAMTTSITEQSTFLDLMLLLRRGD